MSKNKIIRVVVALKAQQRYDEMVEELKDRYLPHVAQKFTDDFVDVVNKLKKNPAIFQHSNERKDTRRTLFSKYGAFLYKISEDTTLVITTFFDTREKR